MIIVVITIIITVIVIIDVIVYIFISIIRIAVIIVMIVITVFIFIITIVIIIISMMYSKLQYAQSCHRLTHLHHHQQYLIINVIQDFVMQCNVRFITDWTPLSKNLLLRIIYNSAQILSSANCRRWLSSMRARDPVGLF